MMEIRLVAGTVDGYRPDAILQALEVAAGEP